MHSSIIGTGRFFPPKLLTNAMLETMVDTSDEWIVQRTGMSVRHIADNLSLCDMALPAARQALAQAALACVDMIVVATSTPDYFFPSVACRLAASLEMPAPICLDISAACTGFLQALDLADRYIRTGAVQSALVVSAEKLSAVTDYTDRGTCVLFGDAAAAFVLQAGAKQHFQAAYLASRPKDWETLTGPVGAHLIMNGPEVYKFAVSAMPLAIEQVLTRAGRTIDDIRWIIPHQANIRIIRSVMQRFQLPPEKVMITLDKTGNTSSATIPCIVDELHREGKFQPGDAILMVAFGAGLTYGALLYEW